MTMRNLVRAAMGLAACSSFSALALIDAELLYGKRWYEIKPKSGSATGVQGTDVYVGAHLDPIPLVPIAFGASVSLVDLKTDDLGADVSEAKVVEPALDVVAWIPMVPFVTPYAKVKIPVMSKYSTKQTRDSAGTKSEETAVYKLSGYHLNAGIKYSPLPLIKVLVEGGLGMQKATADEIKMGGVEVNTAGADLDMNSKYLAVGLEVGL